MRVASDKARIKTPFCMTAWSIVGGLLLLPPPRLLMLLLRALFGVELEERNEAGGRNAEEESRSVVGPLPTPAAEAAAAASAAEISMRRKEKMSVGYSTARPPKSAAACDPRPRRRAAAWMRLGELSGEKTPPLARPVLLPCRALLLLPLLVAAVVVVSHCSKTSMAAIQR